MIIVLHADGSVVLEQAGDFHRFHCEMSDGIADWEQARELFPIGEIESRETAWVDENALYALGGATEGPEWIDQARAMVASAANYGWVRQRAPTVRSHIVWRQKAA